METQQILTIVAFLQTPTWGLMLWILKDNRHVKDCVIKMKIAFRIAHPELSDVLKD